MSLYHFYWRGKERTVSIDKRRKDSVTLHFIDQEIVDLIGGHLLVLKRDGSLPDEPGHAREIVSAVKEKIGDL